MKSGSCDAQIGENGGGTLELARSDGIQFCGNLIASQGVNGVEHPILTYNESSRELFRRFDDRMDKVGVENGISLLFGVHVFKYGPKGPRSIVESQCYRL